MTWFLERLGRSAGQFLVIGLVFAGPLVGQEQGASIWHGYLRNTAGAPIAGAKVRLAGAATAQVSTATDGAFTLPALPRGQYKLTVATEGRKVAYAQAIDLAVAAPVELITLSNRGEIEVSEQQQTGATGAWPFRARQ
jgi:hypothetical protein